MQIDNPHPALPHRPQEALSENVHPPSQHNQIRFLGQHFLSQCGIVPRTRRCQLRRVRLALGLEAARDHVEVLGWHTGIRGARRGVGSLAVHKEADDLGVRHALRGQAVEERLEVAAAAASHDDDARGGGCRGSHGGLGAFGCRCLEGRNSSRKRSKQMLSSDAQSMQNGKLLDGIGRQVL